METAYTNCTKFLQDTKKEKYEEQSLFNIVGLKADSDWSNTLQYFYQTIYKNSHNLN